MMATNKTNFCTILSAIMHTASQGFRLLSLVENLAIFTDDMTMDATRTVSDNFDEGHQ